MAYGYDIEDYIYDYGDLVIKKLGLLQFQSTISHFLINNNNI